MREKTKKVLLSVDGTDESLEVVKYVSQALPAAGAEIRIYNVLSKVPEVFWDLGNEPGWEAKIESIRQYELQQAEAAAVFMDNAVEILRKAGHPAEKITTRIEAKHEGIARDILVEARRGGYDLLILGRGQVGSLPNMPLGSVASKVLSSVSAPAVWLVGGKPDSSSILVALDTSADSLAVVRHAATLCNRGSNSITLFHAIRGIAVSGRGMEDIFPEAYCQRLMEDAEQGIRKVFASAETLLQELDIAPARIATKIVTSVSSRAEAVIAEAIGGGYGTIVAGRRGLSQVETFTMGRVTNKLIQLAKEQCLCIVG